MEPTHVTHHLHISSGAIFLFILLLAVIIVGFLVWSSSKRKAKIEQQRLDNEHEERMSRPIVQATVGSYRSAPLENEFLNAAPSRMYSPSYGGPASAAASYPTATAPVIVQQPIYQPPMYQPGLGGSGFVEGMLIGELMTGGREREVIVHDEPSYRHDSYRDNSYVDNSSWDSGSSGVTYDSGSSYSDSSSSDSSSGIDINW